MFSLSKALDDLLNAIFGYVPSLVSAIILLALALVVALIVKAIVIKLCSRLHLEKHFRKKGVDAPDGKEISDLIQTIGRITFVLVFAFFLPAILSSLKLDNISAPVTGMMNSIVGYLPNILGAAAIFFIGMYLAKIIKQIVVSILKGVRFDKLQEKAGMKSDESAARFSSLIGTIVYALIIIPVIIASLMVLGIDAITGPAVNMLDSILSVAPNVMVAIVLIFVGVFLGKLAGSLLSALLAGVGANKLLSNYMKEPESGGKKILLSDIIGNLVKYIIILLLVVQSFAVLQLDVLNNLGTMIVLYLPDFIGALIIFGAGFFLAGFVEKTMKEHASTSVFSTGLVKALIVTITIFMTLNQLKVASLIVNATFVVILCAIAVAFAISFGIGGKDTASRVLKGLQDAFSKKENTEEKKNQEK